MKWPFVRRSKYDNLQNQVNCLHKIHGEYAQLNHDNLHEINSLNQELASELNSHRETKKLSQQRLDAYNTLNHKYRCLVKELEETKDALKIAQEETRQHRMTIDFADEKEEKIKQYLIKVINYI